MISFTLSLQHSLEDILGELQFARRQGDLGRLALLASCEVRRWAREANADDLASQSWTLMNNFPYPSRDEFLKAVDDLIAQVELVHCSVACLAPSAEGVRVSTCIS